MHDELQIIERVLTGQTASFRGLVDLYGRLVFQFVRNMLHSVEDAEDLTQDVFVTAFQNLASFDARRARFSTWLLTIARNRCLNHLKRRSPELPGDIEVTARELLPEDVAAEREVWQQLSAALDELPVEQRTAFVLAEIQNLPHAEIAEIEGIELGTVKSRVSRARDRLRQVLKTFQPGVHEMHSPGETQ